MTDTSATTAALDSITGVHHVRLSVTDLGRSRAFYEGVLGLTPAIESEGDASDPAVREDPAQYFGGVIYGVGSQLLGLRPIADGDASGDDAAFDPATRGLDHVSLQVGSRDDLVRAAALFEERGIAHGEVIDFPTGMSILSVQDPDDINVELVVAG
ncbi:MULTISPECIES: VOC family protein [Clavibacter]|uniref:Glyoxalase-like domain protein n=2 Tax=Clavibacter michiganensis subsp. michiganensis TaxID=33013 RepID=A0A1Y3FH73_CLAMM|nr:MULTISPECIES: VOC family protein [Clavibacter]KAF0257385.1 Glyoxalase-like domain protein [Clavibacter michiganensis subsp. michiganensis]MBE3079616.1 VOC family protein [Clavibacter michiganensis subsp. michiganensis]MBF4620929.1 VOC family protein [Clavibacter sp. VKM Ac-2542]MBF4637540.1 VOC family protein [Clavibacter michiganensis subsp. michiganensis]MBW8025789.1 VOC family protein [Clavibacter michiganensis subsp. michiganensis]